MDYRRFGRLWINYRITLCQTNDTLFFLINAYSSIRALFFGSASANIGLFCISLKYLSKFCLSMNARSFAEMYGCFCAFFFPFLGFAGFLEFSCAFTEEVCLHSISWHLIVARGYLEVQMKREEKRILEAATCFVMVVFNSIILASSSASAGFSNPS